MIDYLRGTVAILEPDYIVLDVNGIGYRVFCPNPFVFQNQQQKEITVYIHHHVREDAILLYGFATRKEQQMFRRLLDVGGIGPKVALGMLKGASPEAIVLAIQGEDAAFLGRLPGIGKKTAQRIILDLKDKLTDLDVFPAAFPSQKSGSQSGTRDDSVWNDAKEALLSLGYSESEIARISGQIRADGLQQDSVDVLIKKALQLLFKG